MRSLDLQELCGKKIITQETGEWMEPLYEAEESDLEEIRRAAEERKNDLGSM